MTGGQSVVGAFDPRDRLYHFTNSAGLYGILASQCIWATHYRFLNDTSEFHAAYEALQGFIEGQLRESLQRLKSTNRRVLATSINKDVYLSTEAGKITKLIFDTILTRSDGFVFSTLLARRFGERIDADDHQSNSVDSFLHWTAYGRGGGYALEFNPERLCLLFNKEQERRTAVSYAVTPAYYSEPGDVPKELREQFDKIGAFAAKIFEESALAVDGRTEGKFGEIAEAVIRILASVKHRFFRAENEYRFVVLRTRDGVGAPEVLIRGEGIPYIRILEGYVRGEDSPLERIIVGPVPDIDLQKTQLRTFLDLHGLSRIEVEVSKAPYRSAVFG